MRRRVFALILAAAGILLTLGRATDLRAQTPLRFQYQRWRDRYEGLTGSYQVVGERLVLVSAIARAGLVPSKMPERITLGFTAHSSGNVSITVREWENNYLMEPIDQSGKKTFKAQPGFNNFAWDAAVVNYIHRTAQDLYALIEWSGAGSESVYPAIVFDSNTPLPPKLQVNEYEFAFLPNAEADLSYQIQASDGRTLKAANLVDLPEGQAVLIRWKPAGQTNGVYQLKAQAKFHFKNGVPGVTQHFDINFYHVNTIHVAT